MCLLRLRPCYPPIIIILRRDLSGDDIDAKLGSMRQLVVDGNEATSKHTDRRTFWTSRYAIDEALKVIAFLCGCLVFIVNNLILQDAIFNIETSWLGAGKWLMIGGHPASISSIDRGRFLRKLSSFGFSPHEIEVVHRTVITYEIR